ncbi:MAG: hypothetical protein AAF789_12385 [Bacteroidota bacterium]
MKVSQLNILERSAAPTPKFFKKLRNIGLFLAAAGGAVFASPIALPMIAVKVAGYLTVAGGVLTAVSQTAVDEEAMESQIIDRYEQRKEKPK